MFLLGTLFLIRTISQKMFLIRTFHIKYIEKKFFLVNELFYSWNKKFRYTFLTKNVPHHLIPLNLKVQIFSIGNNKVITILKNCRLFLLGTLFLIRTVSEKMFLIRTFAIKYMENLKISVNGHFLCLNKKIISWVLIKKCSLTHDTLKSVGSR